MKLPRWIPVQQDRVDLERKATAEGPLQVKNLTRQTVLASRLEVADSGHKRSKGLLGRSGLSQGEGLWIVPCESVHTFFMRFSIDLVYLDRKLRVHKVRSNVPPWRMSACLSAHSVIELPPGTAQAARTKRGDVLEFSAATGSGVGPDKSGDVVLSRSGKG